MEMTDDTDSNNRVYFDFDNAFSNKWWGEKT